MRIYGAWGGRPHGIPEDTERCVVAVYDGHLRRRQCERKRGGGPDGLYCSQHARLLAAGRSLRVPEDS